MQKFLLYCGILFSFLSLGTDILAGKLIKGYNFSAQSMSELSAAGSPTRSIMVALSIVSSALIIAFGIGIWQTTGTVMLPRIVAGLIIGNAFTGLIATLFFPNRFGVQPKFGTPGVLLMFISVLCFVLAMVFGAIAFNSWMRMLSIAIPSAYVLLTILRFVLAASPSEENVLLIGAQERTMSYSYLVWIIFLAIYLLMMNRLADSVK